MSLVNALGLAVPLLITAVLVVLAVRRDRRRPRYRLSDLADPSPLPGERPLPLWSRQPGQAVTHLTPDHDQEQVTGCCSVPLGDVPPGDVLSHDQARVTCRREPDPSGSKPGSKETS